MLPGFVDSHSHLVFAGDRSEEFAARMAGTPYAAGGIRTTVAATRAATDEQLTSHVARLVAEMRRQGTTTVEIKSGYGLTVRDEARSLAVARQFTEETTFLGAHVVPDGDPAAYVELVTGPMLDAAKEHARWIDVFCEQGAFDEDQARAILTAGAARRAARAGCTPTSSPSARASGSPPSSAWSRSTTAPTSPTRTSPRCATAAPSRPCCRASSSRPSSPTRTRAGSSTPASRSRSPSDCNPGSCFTSSLPLCIALAVREMGMTPAEAVHAATYVGAQALDRDDVGALTVGVGPTSCCSTRRATCTWPTVPASRSSSAPGSAAGRSDRRMQPPTP